MSKASDKHVHVCCVRNVCAEFCNQLEICAHVAVCSHRLKRPRSGSKELTSQVCVVYDNAEVTQDMVDMQTGSASEDVCTTRSESGLEVHGSGPDIGTISHETLDDSERRTILENKWVPAKHYKFPKNSQNRRYSCNWEDKYPWLRYSPSLNGAYCSACFCFAQQDQSMQP